jgi:hypothetical protein
MIPQYNIPFNYIYTYTEANISICGLFALEMTKEKRYISIINLHLIPTFSDTDYKITINHNPTWFLSHSFNAVTWNDKFPHA